MSSTVPPRSRRFFVAAGLVILTLTLLSGCEKSRPKSGTPPGALTASATILSEMTSPPGATASAGVALNTLAVAQKEYLAAYEVYVKCLRESGPQTLETLQALADYQKKYQLYQMILEAGKK